MNFNELKEFLDFKSRQYNCPAFIETDPISIPHQFTRKEDIEIAGFLTAILSWGNRKSIIQAANLLMQRLDQDPFKFIMFSTEKERNQLKDFYYRTFQKTDIVFFLNALNNIYMRHGGLEQIFQQGLLLTGSMFDSIEYVRNIFLTTRYEKRNIKHLPSPAAGSAAKRIHMFLRWMCRKDTNGVDFGIWNFVKPSQLFCPLDIHSGNVARKLGLLHRKSNDRKAVEELTLSLQKLDPVDPVQYDFALFGLSFFEKFH